MIFSAAVALICAASFGLNLKFESVKEDIYAANSYFKFFIKERALAVGNELKLIEKYIGARDFNIKDIFDFSLKDNPEYKAFFIVNEQGEIEFASDENLRAKYSAFFLSKPWQSEPTDKILRSEFMFNKGDAPSRFIAKKIKGGKTLAVLVCFTAIYEEFARKHEEYGVKSFVIDKNGKILFHQDLSLIHI